MSKQRDELSEAYFQRAFALSRKYTGLMLVTNADDYLAEIHDLRMKHVLELLEIEKDSDVLSRVIEVLVERE